MKLEELYNRAVFVDANAFIYYLEGICNEFAANIIKAGSRNVAKIKLVTTVRVCDEVLFKMAIIRAKAIDPSFSSDTVKKLRRKPDIVKSLVKDLTTVVHFFQSLNLKILPMDRNILFHSLEIIEKYGLFGNDALSVYVMQRRNMKYLLSSDKDFDLVDWIVRIDALR